MTGRVHTWRTTGYIGRWFLFFAFLCVREAWGAGSNTVIVNTFDWKMRRIPSVNVYYYGAGGETLFPFVREYLLRAGRRARKAVPFAPLRPFPFMLYNSHNEFEQTNVTSIGEGTGGVTEAFKDRLLLSHNGSQRQLEYITAHEYMHEIEFAYIFQDSYRSVRLLTLQFYPNWLLEGMAEYASGDLDYTTREMYLRDAATSGGLLSIDDLFNFNHVLPHQVTLAYKESEALMHYIVDEYGPWAPESILGSFTGTFSSDSALAGTVGTDEAVLDRRFREFLEDSYAEASRGLDEPSACGRRLTSPGTYPSFNRKAAFSPDGAKLAYLSDRQGVTELYLLDLASGRTELLWNMARSVGISSLQDEGGGPVFTPDGKGVLLTGKSGQKDYLYTYDLEGRTMKKTDVGIYSLASPCLSKDGSVVYFSGLADGSRDLYAFSFRDRTLTRLTAGPLDDIDAAPSPDGRYLFYAGEAENSEGRMEYDLWRLDLATKETVQLTSLPGDERSPAVSPDGTTLYFTSDQDCVNDIYRMGLGSGAVERVTRVVGGAFDPRLSPDGSRLVFASFRKTQMHLYLADLNAVTAAAGEVPSRSRAVFGTRQPLFNPATVEGTPPVRYRFRVSNDYFLPALYYSSLDGLFAVSYWQISELFGNHQLSAAADYASSDGTLDYQVQYSFLRYRTRFFATLVRNQYYLDFLRSVRHKDVAYSLYALYPLNRFQAIGAGAATNDIMETQRNEPENDRRDRQNSASLFFTHDTTYGPYLEALKGVTIEAQVQAADTIAWGTVRFQDYFARIRRFIPLGGEQALYWSPQAYASYGDDRTTFPLGGESRVRGIPSDSRVLGGNKLFVNTLEWRFPVVHNIDYHVRFFFPDFFFKSFYGAVFADAGTAWNEGDAVSGITLSDWKGSYGVSFRLHTFILESIPFLWNIQLARRMDGPEYALYFGVGYTLFIGYAFGGQGDRMRPPPSGRRMPARF